MRLQGFVRKVSAPIMNSVLEMSDGRQGQVLLKGAIQRGANDNTHVSELYERRSIHKVLGPDTAFFTIQL